MALDTVSILVMVPDTLSRTLGFGVNARTARSLLLPLLGMGAQVSCGGGGTGPRGGGDGAGGRRRRRRVVAQAAVASAGRGDGQGDRLGMV